MLSRVCVNKKAITDFAVLAANRTPRSNLCSKLPLLAFYWYLLRVSKNFITAANKDIRKRIRHKECTASNGNNCCVQEIGRPARLVLLANTHREWKFF